MSGGGVENPFPLFAEISLRNVRFIRKLVNEFPELAEPVKESEWDDGELIGYYTIACLAQWFIDGGDARRDLFQRVLDRLEREVSREPTAPEYQERLDLIGAGFMEAFDAPDELDPEVWRLFPYRL